MPTHDLAAWLSSLAGPDLERLLDLRPDVTLGAPVRDLEDLAERLAHRASVAAIVRELPLPALEVLEALTALGAGAREDAAAALLDPGARGADEQREAVGTWTASLVDSALVWPDGSGRLRLNAGAVTVLAVPLGVGVAGAHLAAQVSAADLQRVARRWGLDVPKRKADLVAAVLEVIGDPVRVRRLLADAPPKVAEVLAARADEEVSRMGAPGPATVQPEDDLPGYLRTPSAYGQYRIAAEWALENGLSFGSRYDPVYAQLPSEVLLALAGTSHHAPFTPQEPHLPTAAVADEQVQATAAAAVTELLGTVMALLELLVRNPVTILKAGGVGGREITRVAKELDSSSSDVRLALELAWHLDLLARTGARTIGVGDGFTSWRARPPEDRAADLVRVWVGLGYAPTLDRDEEGTLIAALARFHEGDAAIAARGLMLGALAELPEGKGLTSAESLTGALAWRAPVVLGPRQLPVVASTAGEVERLGLVALGRLTHVGRALVTSGAVDALADALRDMLPDVQTRAVVGSDLTVAVLGSPSAEVVDVLDAVALRETRGPASTWRLTPGTVRGALDSGYAADDVLTSLQRVAGGELPQPVTYLVHDVARRHGHVQVRPAGSVVLAQDEALLTEVGAHRALRRLGLHRVAPTVLLADARPDVVLEALRGAGYLPVEAHADGAPVVELRRLPAGEESSVAAVPVDAALPADGTVPPDGAEPVGELLGTDDADAALARWAAELAADGAEGIPLELPSSPRESPSDLVARLQRGESPPQHGEVRLVADLIAQEAPRLSGIEVEQLAHAVVHGLPVRIRYRSRSGGISVRVVSDLVVDDRYLLGWCHERAGSRSFLLGSVLGVIAEPV